MHTDLHDSLHLLLDPQGFCESLFEKHLQNKKSKLPLETRLDVLQLVTRLVGLHKLVRLPWLASYYLDSQQLTPLADNFAPILVFHFAPHSSTTIRHLIPGFTRSTYNPRLLETHLLQEVPPLKVMLNPGTPLRSTPNTLLT